MEENQYYPYGLKHSNYNPDLNFFTKNEDFDEVELKPAPNDGIGGTTYKTYNYKFNGKEFQDELALNMYDYGARNYDPAIGRWMNIDNMAEKYLSNSPYHYAGNNPILYLDVDGNEFTESAWKWVNKLISDINSRQEKNNKSIDEYKSKIAEGGTERQLARWNRNIIELNSNNTTLETVRSETATLAASNQVYDVINDSKGTNSEGTTNSTSFNFKNGNVEISVSSGTSVGLFAHELKHAYQFEKGTFSVGPQLSSGKYSNLFYDKNDEIEAYNRGALFGERSYSLKSLPSEYANIATGPNDFRNLRVNTTNPQQYLQNLANTTMHAFRIDGKTYYKKR